LINSGGGFQRKHPDMTEAIHYGKFIKQTGRRFGLILDERLFKTFKGRGGINTHGSGRFTFERKESR